MGERMQGFVPMGDRVGHACFVFVVREFFEGRKVHDEEIAGADIVEL